MIEDHEKIGTILEELRAEVRARRLAQGRSEISPVEQDLRRSLDEIELYRVISAHWPLLGKTVPQRAVALLNKLVRRYLRWYINPIVEQQNAYNDAVARTLRLLAEAYAELGEQIAEHRPPTDEGERGRGGEGENPRMEGGGWRMDSSSSPSVDDDQQHHASRFTHHASRFTHHASPEQSYAEMMSLVRERAAGEPAAAFPDLELRALEPHLSLREQVSAHWPLSGETAAQRAVALLNKLVRRYLRWYINPIVEQQNAANAAYTAALRQLIRLDAARRAEVARLRARRPRPAQD